MKVFINLCFGGVPLGPLLLYFFRKVGVRLPPFVHPLEQNSTERISDSVARHVGLKIIPIVGQIVFTDQLPERLRFEKWPLWLQIPFGLVVVLYFIVDVWFMIRPPGRQQGKDERPTVQKRDEKQST